MKWFEWNQILLEEPITEQLRNEEINEFHLRYRQPTFDSNKVLSHFLERSPFFWRVVWRYWCSLLLSLKVHSPERKAQVYSLHAVIDQLLNDILNDLQRLLHFVFNVVFKKLSHSCENFVFIPSDTNTKPLKSWKK